MSCLSWKWRKRSFVKTTERTHETAKEAPHAGKESCRSEAAFVGSGVTQTSIPHLCSAAPLHTMR
jgi:hypothetical protein